jgi:hypothetical protein
MKTKKTSLTSLQRKGFKFLPAACLTAALLSIGSYAHARIVRIGGIGVQIKSVNEQYRFQSSHLDTASWDAGLIFPKSTIPARVKDMEYACVDWRPFADDNQTDDAITSIRADATGDLLIAMPSPAATGDGWVRVTTSTTGDFFLDRATRSGTFTPTTFSYWFYRRPYNTANTPVGLPKNSISTVRSAFVFAKANELRWANPKPLPPNSVLIARKIDSARDTQSTVANPSFIIRSNGDYIACASGLVGSQVWRSTNKGSSWSALSGDFSINRQSVFEVAGVLYVIGEDGDDGGTRIYRSSNGGSSWTTALLSGLGVAGGDAPSHVDIVNGRIWKACAGANGEPRLLSADVNANLMVTSSWTVAQGGPTAGTYTLANGQRGKVINGPEGTLLTTREGRVINATKSTVFRSAADGEREGIAQVYAVNTTTTKADVNYAGPYLPGTASKYTVRFDPVSDKYWALTTVGPTRSQLNLYSATTSGARINDFKFVRTILTTKSFYDGWNYPFMQIEGNDIVFVLRTAWGDDRGMATRWHNGNNFTFHRIRNFRSL